MEKSHEYSDMRTRVRSLNELLMHSDKDIWRLRRLFITINSSSYVLILRKNSTSLIQRTELFYNLLQSNLQSGEILSTANECFTICGAGYTITYSIEGYKESSDKICFFEKGVAYTRLLRRTPIEIAFKQTRDWNEKHQTKIQELMESVEWIEKYPNPAERFAKIVSDMKKVII